MLKYKFRVAWARAIGVSSMKPRHLPANIFLTILISICSLLASEAANANEFVDGDNEPPTQLNGMHTCPPGFLVAGVHVAQNLLLCTGPLEYALDFPARQSWGVRTDNQFAFDGGSMHWCGTGSAVRGVHVDGNGFNCQSFDVITESYFGEFGAPEIDRATQRSGMHACQIGKVLVGAHFATNTFLCADLNVCTQDIHCTTGKSCQFRTPRSILGRCE
jgi:hypothetical protein